MKLLNNIILEKKYSNENLLVFGRKGELNQVFVNILGNAIDAIENKVTGKKNITISTATNNSNVVVSIKDNGLGMRKEDQKNIFDPFFTTKAAGKGTGLGLSISYRIINDHKGKIDLISELGSGSEFKIFLPTTPK